MTRPPSFGGVPDRVRRKDWLLVEWVATAKRGAPYPEPWCHTHSPLLAMVAQLIELRVMEQPAPGTDVATIAREATAAARQWIEQHPEPDPEPEPERRGMRWGPNRRPQDR
jgi:hypothetical protein